MGHVVLFSGTVGAIVNSNEVTRKNRDLILRGQRVVLIVTSFYDGVGDR